MGSIRRRAAMAVTALVVAAAVVPLGPRGDAAAAPGDGADRLAGANRYETAAQIARAAWPAGASRVYLTRSDDFADSLAAGSLRDGPLLLAPPCGSLPAATERALDDLDPATVVAVGGTAAICQDVLDQAAAGRAADRIAGRDRFETAAAIARHTFATAGTVYLANGETLVDAIAGGSLSDGPILLVTKATMPTATAEAIRWLGADRVVALGGEAVIPDAVLDDAAADGRTSARLSGADRHETAAAIAEAAYPAGATTVYLAQSTTFADAVAAAPLNDGPVVLVPRCGPLPPAVAAALRRIGPRRVIALGGAAAVCDGLLADARGLGADVTVLPRITVPVSPGFVTHDVLTVDGVAGTITAAAFSEARDGLWADAVAVDRAVDVRLDVPPTLASDRHLSLWLVACPATCGDEIRRYHVPITLTPDETVDGRGAVSDAVSGPTLASPARARHARDGDAAYVGDLLLAMSATNATRADVEQAAARIGGVVEDGDTEFRAWTIAAEGAGRARLEDLADQLAEDPAIVAADPYDLAVIGSHAVRPDDWDDDSHVHTWHHEMIRAPEAWEIRRHASSVPIGIHDAGIWPLHDDLYTNSSSYRFVPGTTWVDRLLGGSHGTHVAGLACGLENPGESVGLVGVAWSCDMHSFDWSQPSGVSGRYYFDNPLVLLAQLRDLYNAQRPRVVNLSWGVGPHQSHPDGYCDPDTAVTPESTVGRIYRSWLERRPDTLWVTSAGNCGLDSRLAVPGNAGDLPNVMTVAAVDESGALSSFSGHGDVVEIAAPGGYSTAGTGLWSAVHRCADRGGGFASCTSEYGTMSGTSMASPLVAGAAALVFAHRPGLTPAQVATCLRSSGRTATGTGLPILDVPRALGCAERAGEAKGDDDRPADQPAAPLSFEVTPNRCDIGTCHDPSTAMRGVASGFTPGGTVSIRVYLPDGREHPSYLRSATADGSGAFPWLWWHDAGEPIGTYRTVVTDTATGRAVERSFTLTDGSAPTPAPSPQGRIQLAQGGSAPAGSWYAVSLSGFPPNSQVRLTCRDSVDPGGFYTEVETVDASGNGGDSTLCYSADGPDHWVTAGDLESNRVSWGPGSGGGGGGGGGTPTIRLSRGGSAPHGYWYSVSLSGWPPNSSVTLTCRDSVDPGGFYTEVETVDASGNGGDSTLCYSADGPDHWVTGGGAESNHVSW